MKRLSSYQLIVAVMLCLPLGGTVYGQAPAPDPAPQPQQPSAAVAAPADDHLKKGIELNQAKQYQQAESALRAAVTADPSNPLAHLQLGIALIEQGKLAEAEKEMQAAKPMVEAAERQQADYYHYRGALYARQEKWNEALQDLQKAIQLDPMRPYNHYYIGVAYSKLKKPDRMVEHLQMFLKLAPNAPEAAKCRALLRAL